MAKRTKLRVVPTIAIGMLTLVLCLGIGALYVGWEPGARLSPIGYVAMATGLAAAILLGVGVALLIHRSKSGD